MYDQSLASREQASIIRSEPEPRLRAKPAHFVGHLPKENHWYHWTTDAVKQGETEQLEYNFAEDFGPNKFSEANKYIKSKDHKQKPIPFNAPKQPFQPTIHEPKCICRVTITYQDIFHRKHASIYDFVFRQGWRVVAFIDDITNDLSDLVA